MRNSIRIGLIFIGLAASLIPATALESPWGDQDAVVYVYRSPPDKLIFAAPRTYDVILGSDTVSNLTDKSYVVLHLKPGSLVLKIDCRFGTQTVTLNAIGNEIQFFRVDTFAKTRSITLTQVDREQAEKDMNRMSSRNTKIPEAIAFTTAKPGAASSTPRATAVAAATKSPAPTPADTTGPEVSILVPETKRGLSVVATSKLQHVEGVAKGKKGVYEVQVNGIQASIKDDGSFSVDVPLAVGENILEVVARDTKMNETRKTFTVTRPGDTTPAATPATIVQAKPKTESGSVSQNASGGHNYLLAIAINKYKYWPQLGNAVKDAKDVIGILTSRYQFAKSEVIEIYDEKATVDNIYNGFRELAGKLKEQDSLMIYFSGHGNYDKLLDEGFWIPVDARKTVNTDFLPNSTISKLIKAIPTKHTFLVADACFSGSLFSSGSRGFVENVEQYKSRWGLTSGRLEYVSDGRSGENSPFASYVLKYLRNLSKDAPVSEMVQYVKTSVGNNSDQTPVGSSLRNVGDEGGEFVFHLRK